MDDIKPRRSPGINRERAQFQASYYYAPSRQPRAYITNRNNLRSQPAAGDAQHSVTPPKPSPVQQQPVLHKQSVRSPRLAGQNPSVHRSTVSARAHHAVPATENRSQIQVGQPRRKSRLTPAFVTMLFVASAVFIGIRAFNRGAEAQPQASSAQPAANQPNTVAPIEQPVDTSSKEEMDSAINAVIAANKNINTGVTVTDIKSGETFNYGVDAAFDAASTGKVLSAVVLLKQIESGKIDMNSSLGGQPISTLIENLIEQSDNGAWDTINGKLGHTALQDYARSIGMNSYSANGNLMKTSDMATLMTQLYTGKLLNDSNRKLLLDHMKNANKTEYILSAIPDGITTYHKAGWNNDRSHDAAIIDNGTKPYVLVIYTKGLDGSDTDQRISIIRQITGATTAHFISKTTAAKTKS